MHTAKAHDRRLGLKQYAPIDDRAPNGRSAILCGCQEVKNGITIGDPVFDPLWSSLACLAPSGVHSGPFPGQSPHIQAHDHLPGRAYLHTITAHDRPPGARTSTHLQPITAFRAFLLAYTYSP